jgi:hypothetical protein
MHAAKISVCGGTHVDMFKKTKALSGIKNEGGYSKILTCQIGPELLEE